MTPSDTPPVGGDWVLRPREPTDEMLAAADDAIAALRALGHHDKLAVAVWLSMLSAAPPPPVGDREAVARIIEGAIFDALVADVADEEWGDISGEATDAILRLLGLSPSLSPGELALADPLPPERCVCGCSSFARMDESAPGGGFRKGRQFRCVQCKREHDERHTGSEPSGAGGL